MCDSLESLEATVQENMWFDRLCGGLLGEQGWRAGCLGKEACDSRQARYPCIFNDDSNRVSSEQVDLMKIASLDAEAANRSYKPGSVFHVSHTSTLRSVAGFWMLLKIYIFNSGPDPRNPPNRPGTAAPDPPDIVEQS